MLQKVIEFVGGPLDGRRMPFADLYSLLPETFVTTQISASLYREARYEVRITAKPSGHIYFRYVHTGSKGTATIRTRRKQK